jgi:hypothetical protein
MVIETATGNIGDGEGIIIDDNSNSQTNGIQYTGGTLVENNVSYLNGSEGIEVGNSSNVDVLYNTTYENGQSGVNTYEIAALIAPNAVIENNIMYAKANGRQRGKHRHGQPAVCQCGRRQLRNDVRVPGGRRRQFRLS